MDRPDRHRKASFGVICLWAAPLILAGYVLACPFIWKWTSTRGVEYTLPSGVVVLDHLHANRLREAIDACEH